MLFHEPLKSLCWNYSLLVAEEMEAGLRGFETTLLKMWTRDSAWLLSAVWGSIYFTQVLLAHTPPPTTLAPRASLLPPSLWWGNGGRKNRPTDSVQMGPWMLRRTGVGTSGRESPQIKKKPVRVLDGRTCNWARQGLPVWLSLMSCSVVTQ